MCDSPFSLFKAEQNLALQFVVDILLCRSMPPTLTHTGTKAHGAHWHKSAGKDGQSKWKGLKTTGKRPLYAMIAAHNLKVVGSNPAPATKEAGCKNVKAPFVF